MKPEKFMHTRGVVTDIDDGGYARIVMNRKNACGGCGESKKDNCKSCIAGGVQIQAKVLNTEHAGKGDIVTVSLGTASLMKGAAALYLIPVAGIMAGTALGHGFYNLLPLSDTAATIFAGLAGLVIGFFIVKAISERMEADQSIIPRISKILFAKSGRNESIGGRNKTKTSGGCPGCGCPGCG